MYFCNVIVFFKVYLDDKRGSMHTPRLFFAKNNGYSYDINIFPNYYGHERTGSEAF